MSEIIRQLRASGAANPGFDMDGFLRAVHSPGLSEPPMPPPEDDYARMRAMHEQAMINYGNYGTRDSGRAGLYHRSPDPRFPGYVGPEALRQKAPQYYTDPVLQEPPAPR